MYSTRYETWCGPQFHKSPWGSSFLYWRQKGFMFRAVSFVSAHRSRHGQTRGGIKRSAVVRWPISLQFRLSAAIFVFYDTLTKIYVSHFWCSLPPKFNKSDEYQWNIRRYIWKLLFLVYAAACARRDMINVSWIESLRTRLQENNIINSILVLSQLVQLVELVFLVVDIISIISLKPN